MPEHAGDLSSHFIAKKQSILSQLALDPKDYEDKSPKGSVDVQILDLLRLINDVDGWVTTSSCSGRVAVFVEGPKKVVPGQDASDNGDESKDLESQESGSPRQAADTNDIIPKTAPGGKGGGHWLYVSHDPLPVPSSSTGQPSEHWTQTFNLSRPSGSTVTRSQSQRLIHLSFSPLILHVLCASLHHARPLLAAAINAGFRESGVQSLKALEPGYVGEGVMVAIRTNGIVFETIVGVWDEELSEAQLLVDEAYLRMCVGVVNERFRWNTERGKRLVRELREAVKREGWGVGEREETREERRDRKRREGLQRQETAKQEKEKGADRIGNDAFDGPIEGDALQSLEIT